MIKKIALVLPIFMFLLLLVPLMAHADTSVSLVFSNIYLNTSNGTQASANTYLGTDFIEAFAGSARLDVSSGHDHYLLVFKYNAAKGFLGTTGLNWSSINGPYVFELSADVAYIRVQYMRTTYAAIGPSEITSAQITFISAESSSSEPSSSIPDDSSSSDDGSDSSDSTSISGNSSSSEPVVVGTAPHPIMTTPLDDYSVTEGLLLILVVFVGLAAVIALFRGR